MSKCDTCLKREGCKEKNVLVIDGVESPVTIDSCSEYKKEKT